VRGAAVGDAPVALPLRSRPERRMAPGSPEELADRARAEAQEIVAGAHAAAAAALESARAEGLEAGRAAAREEVASALDALREATAALAEHRAALEEQLADEATAMAIETAAKLVRAEVAARPERVGDVLRGAIRRAADRSSLVVRVNPADLTTCRALAPAILEEMGGIGALEIVDDPRIGAGACVLETAGGDVDATFASQLTRVMEALSAPPDQSLVEPAAP
jgi:flagellar biosynthesis/type III secretory pathway protein FliH